ncbi:MAG TPA: sigma 54-interacting transcriptional regulator [Symbiobacteriaceae bacterium]|nr:sigma 54-interacting transcriptional regulator [Symbiobacteriaceae bacterium]
MDFQQETQQILEAVASVLRLDVTLVDEQLVRTAGTGTYRQRVGEQVHGDSAFGQALRSGVPVQVAQPRVDVACHACAVRASCEETAHVATPILDGGKPIGVMGLIAFTGEQRERLLHELDRYMAFLAHMSELLAGKLRQERMAGALLATAHSVAEGLVAVDESGAITFLNDSLRRMLRLPPGGEPIHLGELPGLATAVRDVLRTGRPIANRELTVTLPWGPLSVVGTIQPIQVRGQVAGAVASLRDIRDVYDLVYRVGADLPVYGFDKIIYRSAAMAAVVDLARRVAASQSAVLIRGESGTGKELFARAIHAQSRRRDRPFMAINCAAIPEELLESELFGYADGAFTGARRGGKPGKFELANHGTIFLDEIGDMSLRLQAKLLRVLQESEVTRVGGTHASPLDIRVIAATHQNLEDLLKRKEFREDLYFRINVLPVEIPPLRERPEDILLLAGHIRGHRSAQMGIPVIAFSGEVEQILLSYPWPGNVRELQNVVEYAVTMANGPVVGVDALPSRLREVAPPPAPAAAAPAGPLMAVDAWLEQELRRGLALYGSGDKAATRMAKELGISRATVYRRLHEFGLLSK